MVFARFLFYLPGLWKTLCSDRILSGEDDLSFHSLLKAAIIFLLLLLLLAPLMGLSCGEDESVSETSSVGETTIAAGPADRSKVISSDFTNAAICGSCHEEIFNQWRGSMHNYAFIDRFYLGMEKAADEDTGGTLGSHCTVCHTPIGTDSGEVPPTTGPQISLIAKEGVTCDFCHSLTSEVAYAPRNIKLGPFADAPSTFHESSFNPKLTTSDFCGQCHDQNQLNDGFPLQATYTEWKNSAYAAQGIQCQDCHMTPGPGVTYPNPGKAAKEGPDRPHIYTHGFSGGNATALASEEHRRLAIDNLKAAAAVSLSPSSGASPGGSINLDVTVTNQGAGHDLPTGATEFREMWLDLTLTDANGVIIYHSGAIGGDGKVDPTAVMYRTIFRDRAGQPTNRPWLATSILSDHRVPPQGSITEKYTITLPNEFSLPVTAEATLRYRSAPQQLVDQILGAGSLEIPVIDMASAQVEIR